MTFDAFQVVMSNFDNFQSFAVNTPSGYEQRIFVNIIFLSEGSNEFAHGRRLEDPSLL